jgi:hypothetical protein
MDVHKMDVSPTRTIATIYLLAIATIVVVLVWGYCSLFKPKQLENPGLSAYRAPTGAVVHALISLELAPGAENGTETVGQSLKGKGAESAMAFLMYGVRKGDTRVGKQTWHTSKSPGQDHAKSQ